MSEATTQSAAKSIEACMSKWAAAVRNRDMVGIRADHDANMLMFDLPGPLLLRGLDAYMESWDQFFDWSRKPVAFDFTDVEVTAGEDVGFATAIGHCSGLTSDAQREDLTFRLTMGFRKIDASWRIVHEHHSLPAEKSGL